MTHEWITLDMSRFEGFAPSSTYRALMTENGIEIQCIGLGGKWIDLNPNWHYDLSEYAKQQLRQTEQ